MLRQIAFPHFSKITLFLTACLFGSFLEVNAATSPPIAYSNSWFTGFNTFPTQNYFGNATVSTVIALQYKIVLSRTMNDSLYKIGTGIRDLNVLLNNGAYFLYFLQSAETATSFNIQIYSIYMNYVQTLIINYIIIVSTWGPFSFSELQDSPNINISNTAPFNNTLPTINTLNMTGTIKTFCVLTGFYIVTTSTNNQLSLILTVRRNTTSTVSYTLTSLSTSSFNVKIIAFTQFSFSSTVMAAIPGQIIIGYFNAGNQGSLRFTDPGNIITSNNTLVGLGGFYIANNNYLNWNTSVIPSTSISASTTNTFLYFQFNYLILKTIVCPATNPYLFSSSNLCYDTCPAGYYADLNLMACQLVPPSTSSSSNNLQFILEIAIPIAGAFLFAAIACIIYRNCCKTVEEVDNGLDGTGVVIKPTEVTQTEQPNGFFIQLKGVEQIKIIDTQSKIANGYDNYRTETNQKNTERDKASEPSGQGFQIQIKCTPAKQQQLFHSNFSQQIQRPRFQ